MINEQEEIESPKPPKRSFARRVVYAWRGSGVRAFFWHGGNAWYNFWHPYDPSSHGRGRVFLLVYLWKRCVGLLSTRRTDSREYSMDGAPSDFNAHSVRIPRRPAPWHERFGVFLRNSWPARAWGMISFRLYEWWHPLHGGGYGRGRSNRLTLLWFRAGAAVRDSWLVQQYNAASFYLYEWWYPASDKGIGGGYGRNARSRPMILLARATGAVARSPLGRGLSALRFHVYEWWMPPVTTGQAQTSDQFYRRVSRPVLLYRRWHFWFSKTWVGREFGWALDEITHVLYATRAQLGRDLAFERLRGFITRRSTIAVAAVLLVLTLLSYKTIVPRYQKYIEQQYAMQARLFMEKGDKKRAMLRAKQTLAINNENADAVGVVAELLDDSGSPAALHWRARAALLAPTITKRLAVVGASLKYENFPYPAASQAIRSLQRVATNDVQYFKAAGALAIKLGDAKEAAKAYEAALRVEPNDATARMSLAAIRLQSGDPQAAALAKTVLSSLMAEGQMGASPLRSLVAEAFSQRDFEAALQLSTQLLTNKHATFNDGLLRAALLKVAQKPGLDEFLTNLQSRAVMNPRSAADLASWMNGAGMARESRAWLQQVLTNYPRQPMLKLVMADSYVALKDWAALEEWLEKERWLGMDHLRYAMLAMAIRNQPGGQSRSRLPWDRAVAIAGHAPTALNTLSQVTASWGWQQESEQVLWLAAQRFKTAKWPLESLHRMYMVRKDSAGLRRVSQEMCARDPSDTVAQNNFASLSLLLNRDTSKAFRSAEQLYRSHTNEALYASTYAFGLHTQARTADGVQVLEKLSPEARNAPSVAVYEGIMRAALGQGDAAASLLSKADSTFLLPEELALVMKARAQTTTAPKASP